MKQGEIVENLYNLCYTTSANKLKLHAIQRGYRGTINLISHVLCSSAAVGFWTTELIKTGTGI